MRHLRAVLFDLDGTLFDHRGSSRRGAAEFLTSLALRPSESALRRWAAAEDEHFERWRSGEIGFAEQRRERLRTVLPALGHPLDLDDVAVLDELFADYLRRYRAAWRAFPESRDLLDDLRSRGYRLGLLTNGDAEQQLDKLARTGLGDAFDVVHASGRTGLQKPDERAFTGIAHALGVAPSACLFVGDDPERDVAGARRAGMRGLLVDRETTGPAAVRAAVLRALEPGSPVLFEA
ncbi:HAD family hydrolase [Curtobacterium flaccumfaciens pv. beticola]|uniref:HAD family hydrolase n=1 Tax=Curtobacterium flaccumfaciens TaxID=2035 RepID=UPI00349F779C|nr:HAD family hydrolase [Curtobacterium flaccumfaciens pv. basellae]